jgi:redox-sensitive bicupin YhaK (pirin superfamily)
VRLRRAFGFHDPGEFDPFLLFDDFRGDRPDDYLAGFPWHPHRGIETITYVLAGEVAHGDSMGNRGTISTGDVQWMTAGRGILHQEMPRGDSQGRMHGFQLWANLPAAHKMTTPRYQEIAAKDIPIVTEDDGTTARIVTGNFWGARGPVDGIAADPTYVDISVPPGVLRRISVQLGHNAFAYVFAGSGRFFNASEPEAVKTDVVGGVDSVPVENRMLVRFDTGDEVVVQAGGEGMRFLLVSGAPIQEPVAWRGPIVMNTQDEIRHAFEQLKDGTFLNG